MFALTTMPYTSKHKQNHFKLAYIHSLYSQTHTNHTKDEICIYSNKRNAAKFSLESNNT